MRAMLTASLAYAEPFRFHELLRFFHGRACEGVEVVGEGFYARTVRLSARDIEAAGASMASSVVLPAPGAYATGWISVEDDPTAACLRLSMSDGLVPYADAIEVRARCQFDLDCDPAPIRQTLAVMEGAIVYDGIHGVRVPGCFDPFETCCRAVIGQQVSVKAANRMAARLIEALGEPLDAPIEGLRSLFPTPERIAGLADIEATLGPLGIIRQRARVIQLIARMVLDGSLDLSLQADPLRLIDDLVAIKGVGPWTANYIAMRTVKHADAFLETDAGVKHALPGKEPKEILAMAEEWRPYRAYANICLWNSLDQPDRSTPSERGRR